MEAKRFRRTSLGNTKTVTSGITTWVPEGRYLDPRRPQTSIPYNFEGHTIKSKVVLTAIIQDLIVVTYDGADKPFSYLTAVSGLDHCVIHLRDADPDPKHGAVFPTCSLEMLSMMLVKLR